MFDEKAFDAWVSTLTAFQKMNLIQWAVMTDIRQNHLNWFAKGRKPKKLRKAR